MISRVTRWISSSTTGRVLRVRSSVGDQVKPDTVIVDLIDPQTSLGAEESSWRLREAQADYASAQADFEAAALDREASSARLRAERDQLRLKAEADKLLARDGIIAPLSLSLSLSASEDAAQRYAIETRRLAARKASDEKKLAAFRARMEQLRMAAALKQEERSALSVRAGMNGVIQEIKVEEGQTIVAGAALARLSGGGGLVAQLQVSETEAGNIHSGFTALVQTPEGECEGRVVRMDPAVREGAVSVDIALAREPASLRPDLSVEGTIELERKRNVIIIPRPPGARERTRGSLFLLDSNSRARRVGVLYGIASVNQIEVVDGVKEGDRVIVSDLNAWSEFEELRITD
jgi:HlyD family secretion protein